jgi:hypothetical protein
MAAIHDVLRHLLARVPGTQEEHDQAAALIDEAEGIVQPAKPAKES